MNGLKKLTITPSSEKEVYQCNLQLSHFVYDHFLCFNFNDVPPLCLSSNHVSPFLLYFNVSPYCFSS